MIGLSNPHSPEDMPPPPEPPPSHAPRLAARIFAEGGWLQSGHDLEHRPQQETMARAVAAAMRDDEPLLFEAGTGVGKSLAYLLPGIIHAVDQSRQLVVSTHTIALQEQLEKKDIPHCRGIFSSRPELKKYADFKSAVLVGKSNYLCTTRLAAALKDKHELFSTPEHDELRRIAEWADTSRDGLRHELNPPPSPDVWEMVNADSSACARKYCDCEKCFYQRARARIAKANLIIVNHALLFALINAGGAREKGGATRGILFPDDFVVLDEAHTVPGVATDHFGMRLSSYGVDRMLKYLYNPKNKRGLLVKLRAPLETLQLVSDAIEAAHQFFSHIAERVLAQRAIVRVREPGIAEPWLNPPLQALIKAVRTYADKFDDNGEAGRAREELLEQYRKLNTCLSTLRDFLKLSDDESVYWVERTGRRHTIVTLRNAPIDIAPALRETLLERNTSVLFTSATLAMGGAIEPFQQRIGATGVRWAVEKSPFDFERHMRVFAATDIPLPSPKDARLALDALIDYLRHCTLRVPGGSLVLFTSYADMRAAAQALARDFTDHARPFLMQGDGRSRTELARLMREAGNAILFGTDSFWTGIDVPGPALSQVVITRLPFEVPTHPVLEARAEWIRNRGGNPFNELTLPDALIKFRQGVGRLIRTAADRGVVTLLDSRLHAKTYGRLFLECLPRRRVTRMTRENRDDAFLPFE
ncbi:ATP-dependent DNA helicase DinG [Ereboglobus sp. PH5-5]|uniref:ATP-dependent DNA helicase n=1 Tax=Ereboglobus sp. PH5-5 TaxID=2940529 RepID=UPI0024055F72|nr:helicase C-terminal domain-containing protein [Ereboglobus sp. PH5-5]MDF9832802.1 ATP-dependent DNA helicase DinG [Ereboglobus sp. PH5-5]